MDPDAEEEGEAQRLVSTSTVPCERCTRDDPPELESSMVVFSFLLLTAGPSLTYLCFTLSVEYFVQACPRPPPPHPQLGDAQATPGHAILHEMAAEYL